MVTFIFLAFHSLFNRFRDFLLAIVSLVARELLVVLVTNLLLFEGDVSLFIDEPELDELFISSFSAAAMSGKIKLVFDGFFEERGSLDADLHLAPFGCWSHKHFTQNEN